MCARGQVVQANQSQTAVACVLASFGCVQMRRLAGLFLCNLLVLHSVLVEFTDELVAKTSSALASEVAHMYLIPPVPSEFVRLSDEAAHSASKDDLIRHKSILAVFLRFVPSCVPSLTFCALVILSADNILGGAIMNGCTIAAQKYPGARLQLEAITTIDTHVRTCTHTYIPRYAHSITYAPCSPHKGRAQ